jgi:hypothetical protein
MATAFRFSRRAFFDAKFTPFIEQCTLGPQGGLKLKNGIKLKCS